MQALMQDLRYGVRMLRKNPGFALIAVFSLALGIMATTAMYSVIHAVILDPFPYKDVDKLMSVKVWSPHERGFRTYYSTDQFLEIAERSAIFEGVIASTISDVLWTDGAEPQRLRGNFGTARTFQVMGVPPLLGRTYTPEDANTAAAPVAVLGYKFWRRQFGGDPGVIGREMRLNDQVRTVIGVMPKRFMWRGADVYLPVVLRRGQTVEGIRSVHLLGRLKPGVTPAQAEADLRPIIADLKQREPDQFPQQWQVGLLSFKETFPSAIRENLWILFGAVGLLLLIACANVSNLLLAKAGERRKEMTVRAALGASRGRIIRQLLTESLLIAVTGGTLGVLLAVWSLQAILKIVPPNTIPDEAEVTLNMPVLLFALAVSVLTSMLFGLAPALHTATHDLANPLREAGRSMAGSRRQAFLRKSLVVAEVALSLLLLVGAGLMIRSVLAMQNAGLGFRTDRVLTMRVPLPEKRYPDRAQRVAFFQDVLRRVRAVPGVEAVGLNLGLHPLGSMGAAVEVSGAAQQDARAAMIHHTNADYAKAMGITLLQGRLFTESEVDGQRQLALVNQTFARNRLPGRDPLGQVIRIPRLAQAPFKIATDSFEIVGVVKDAQNRNLNQEITPEIYIPFTLAGAADRLAVLAQGDPSALTRAVLNQIRAVDAQQPVTNVMTIDGVLQEFFYADPKFNLVLFAVFAALGLTLAVIGVYGVMSSAVAQQTQEIGLRMALGASPGAVSGMIIKRGARLLATGIGVGLLGSLLATRLLKGYVWNLSAFDSFDPLTFGAVALLLLLAGLQACWWPARRAARIDPLVALRME
ncbi:MAG: ABC transporter permease [Acidobacteria bacterium]|nr:ABC transporter permease [Acidobacteriota bacterium]MBI3426666.1 ABC transporter permease [Acidobacteriota bacterium]